MRTYADVKAFKHENSSTIEVMPISLKSVDKTYRYTQVDNDEDVREGNDRTYIKVVVFETRTKYHYVVMVCNEDRNGMPYEPYEAFSSLKNCHANVVARELMHSEMLEWGTKVKR